MEWNTYRPDVEKEYEVYSKGNPDAQHVVAFRLRRSAEILKTRREEFQEQVKENMLILRKGGKLGEDGKAYFVDEEEERKTIFTSCKNNIVGREGTHGRMLIGLNSVYRLFIGIPGDIITD